MASSGVCMRVFTHPSCPKCLATLAEATRLQQAHPGFELRNIDLADKQGLREALDRKVRVLPTVILTQSDEEIRRWEGSPRPADLEAAVQALAEHA